LDDYKEQVEENLWKDETNKSLLPELAEVNQEFHVTRLVPKWIITSIPSAFSGMIPPLNEISKPLLIDSI
jgi:hypothetical protein